MGNASAKIIVPGNCVFCGNPIDGDGIFFCNECDKKRGIIAKRNMGLTNKDAIEWLLLCMNKGIQFDDDSDETKDLREGARECMKEAFSIAISELDAIRKRRYIPVEWLEELELASKEYGVENNIGKSAGNILKIWEYWKDWKED